MSIRLKVILPYLLLTVVVSVIGVYVVTRLVSTTMRERLTNQLLEAGRVVSDAFTRQEAQHVDVARSVAFTVGLADALAREDGDAAEALVKPLFEGLSGGNLILISPQGREILHLVRDKEGKLIRARQDTGAAQSPIVVPFLKERDAQAAPRRALGLNLLNDETYYYTALPVSKDGEFSGVAMVGTPIRAILPELKTIALADVIFYGGNGQAIGSTLGAQNPEALKALSISEEEFKAVILSDNLVSGQNFEMDGRWYSLARGPLQVGADRVGVFAVALPMDFVIQSGTGSRTTYVVLFTAVFLFVILIGFAVSRLIINPLYALARASQEIANGNLDKRAGVRSSDEIGVLAENFDKMTARLQEYTRDLERMNATLKRIDRTKTNFIQISAHELRTPLTLILGYAQMLEKQIKNEPQSAELVGGILGGAQRMQDVVESMLDVSRIDSNALTLAKTSVRMEEVLEKARKAFASAFTERNLRYSAEGLAELPPIVADPDLLRKAFHHLLMNAIKYTPDGGSVTVSGKYLNGAQPAQLEIVVADTGIGVPADSLEAIFQKFHQTGEVMLHSSGKTKFKGGGPGLGLAIARGIVEAHGGKIWAESPGYDEEKLPGSRFFVRLPLNK